MARPSLTSIDNGVESWEADINDNFDILVDGPFPLKQYADSGSFPAAGSYENCMAVAQDDDKIYVSDGSSWNEVGGASAFTTLSDTPANYTGDGGKVLKVNAGETAVEFDYDDFLNLSDTPSNYTGDGGKVLKVNAGETAVEFSDLSFLDLSDTPSSYTGQSGKILKVNAGETALELVEESGGSGSVTVYSKKLSRWEGYTTDTSVDQNVAWTNGDQLNSYLKDHGALANNAWDTAVGTMNEIDSVVTEHCIMALNGDFDETDTYLTDGRIDFSSSALRCRVDGTSNAAQMRTDGYDGTGAKGKHYLMGIDDSAASIAGSGHLHYSTSEQKTGVNWIDGRAIYCKTVDTGALINNDTASTAHGISGILEVIHIDALAPETTHGGSNTIPNSKASEAVSVWVDENYIYIENNFTPNWSDSHVTVYYTKEDVSTPLEDASEAALGEKRGVDFSLDEHEAGFDVDGSTIYRKVVDFGTLPNSTTKDVLHGILGFKELIKIEGCCYKSSGDVGWYKFPLVYASSPYGSVLKVDREKVSIQSNTDESDWGSGYIVLYYKKVAEITAAKSTPVITGDKTFYITTGGNDLTGDGSSSSPWASLKHAIEVLDNYRIAKQATVTIDIADGTYTSVEGVSITHPDASRIVISGSENDSVGTAVKSVSTGAKTITIGSTNRTADFPAGSLCYVMGSTDNDAVYRVTGSSYTGGDTVVTVNETPQSTTADGTLYDVPCSHEVIFQMAEEEEINVYGTTLGEISGILLYCSSGTRGNGIVVEQGGKIDTADRMAFRRMASGIKLLFGSQASFTTPVCYDCNYGILCSNQNYLVCYEGCAISRSLNKGIYIYLGSLAYIYSNGSGDSQKRLVSSQGDDDGVYVAGQSYLSGANGQAINNGSEGFYAQYNSLIECSGATAKANTTIGFYSHVGSTIRCPNASSTYNGSDGVKAYLMSLVDFSSGSATNNTGHGIYAQDGSVISAGSATSTNNNIGVYSNSGSHILFAGGSSSSNSTNYSPAVDTIGNANSYIDT